MVLESQRKKSFGLDISIVKIITYITQAAPSRFCDWKRQQGIALRRPHFLFTKSSFSFLTKTDVRENNEPQLVRQSLGIVAFAIFMMNLISTRSSHLMGFHYQFIKSVSLSLRQFSLYLQDFFQECGKWKYCKIIFPQSHAVQISFVEIKLNVSIFQIALSRTAANNS